MPFEDSVTTATLSAGDAVRSVHQISRARRGNVGNAGGHWDSVMQSVSDFELESLGVRRGKPRPWGWFFAGLLALVSAGFVLGYYLPLFKAHAVLATEYDGLGNKAKELDHALMNTKAQLKTTEEQRAALQAEKDKREATDAAVSRKLEVAAASVSNALAAMLKYQRLTVDTKPSHLTLNFGKRWIYLPASAKVSASGQRMLCAAMRILSQDDSLHVTASVPVAPEAPLKDWSKAGEQAASVAAILREGCGAAATALRAEARADSDSTNSVLLVVTSNASE